MSKSNLISVAFTADELTQLDASLAAIEKLIKAKCISLTPDERKEYSRIGNKTENWSIKTVNYMSLKPALVPIFVSVAETSRDSAARQALMPRFNRIEAIHAAMDDALMLLGADIYQSCIAFYRNTKLMAEQNVLDAKSVYDDLSAQFPGRPTAKK